MISSWRKQNDPLAWETQNQLIPFTFCCKHSQLRGITKNRKDHKSIVFKKRKEKKGAGITCLPSSVSNPRSCSSQSASRGCPSSHNSPFTLLTRAPFTLQAETQQHRYSTSVRRNSREHVSAQIHLPRTLRNKERGGDTSGPLHGPAISQLDAERSSCSFNSAPAAAFIPEGLKDPQSLEWSWARLQDRKVVGQNRKGMRE